MPTDGLVVVDKPSGWTSHDVVGRCRRLYGQRRVGHSGTLDPGATGVLLVGLGRATRLLRFLTELPKTYVGEIVLGVTTTTLDADGEVTGRFDMRQVSPAEIEAAATLLTGDIKQVPPMVSAVQVGGRRLHELARKGIEVDRPARPVTVYRFDVRPTADPDVLEATVTCSSGTYVRVLAADLGAALGGGAHLRNLRRTAIESFDLEQAHALEEVERDPAACVLTPAEAMADYPCRTVDPETAASVGHGRPIPRLDSDNGPAAIRDQSANLIAVYEPRPGDADLLYAAVVLAAEDGG